MPVAAASAATPDSPDNVFTFWPRHQAAIYERLESKHAWLDTGDGAPVDGDQEEHDPLDHQMTLNIGPQHPATHGVLRAVVKLDGELIEKCVLDIGYLHRGIEKMAEHKTFQEFMPYTDRMDYLSPYSNNVAWCLAVEKLCAIEVPERAQWIRTMACELARVSSHLLWMGVGLMDAGAVSVFLWAWQYREDIAAIFDEIAGARLTVSHSRIGGVASDLTPAALALLRTFVNDMPAVVEGWRKLLGRNRIWVDRNVGIGTLTREEVLAMGMRGPNLRASGVEHDIRRFEPYLKYPEVDFNIPTRTEGDSWARFHVRMEEMLESIKIIRQCLDRLPEGPIRNADAEEGDSVEERGLLLDGGHDPRLHDDERGRRRAEGIARLPRHRGAEGRARLLPDRRRHRHPVALPHQRAELRQPAGPRADDGGRQHGRHGGSDRHHRPGARRIRQMMGA